MPVTSLQESKNANCTAALTVPFERRTTSPGPFRPDVLWTDISVGQLEALESLCQEQGVTLCRCFQAAFSVLLWRYLRSREIALVIINPADSRARLRHISFTHAPGITFARLLQSSGHWNVREMRPDRPVGDLDALSAAFVFAWLDGGEADRPAAALLEAEPALALVCRFKLRLTVIQRRTSLQLGLEYDTSSFARSDLHLVQESFATLINSILLDPSAPIEELDFTSEAQRHRVLSEFNQTQAAYPREKLAHELVQLQAHRGAPGVAVEGNGAQLSYEQLRDQARAVAKQLSAIGVGANSMVALVASPGPDAIVAMLGISMAGAACAPIDPAAPEHKLMRLVVGSGANAVVTLSGFASTVAECCAPMVLLDKVDVQPRASTPTQAVRALPTDSAFVVDSVSGASVRLSHQNLVHATCARALIYLRPVQRYFWVEPIASASSLAGLFWTLLQGATVVVPRMDDLRDAESFGKAIAREQISHLLLSPAGYSALIKDAAAPDLAGLELIVLAASDCCQELLEQHCRRHPDVPLRLEYGHAEATGWSTSLNCADETRTRPCLGRPIPNSQLYVLDSHQRPAPIWAPGEIYLGGDGVAQGYLNEPKLEAERFTLNLYGRLPGARLYRTAQWGRYLPDGTVEFIGDIAENAGWRPAEAWRSLELEQPMESDRLEADLEPAGKGSASYADVR